MQEIINSGDWLPYTFAFLMGLSMLIYDFHARAFASVRASKKTTQRGNAPALESVKSSRNCAKKSERDRRFEAIDAQCSKSLFFRERTCRTHQDTMGKDRDYGWQS